MATSSIDKIVTKYKHGERDIISILQDVQKEHHYIPKEVLSEITQRLKIPLTRAYALATFFSAFSLEPKGEYPVKVCMGTACHVGGGPKILEQLERHLEINEGETTEDGKFSLEEVHCLGCCGLAPVITVGDDVHGKIKVAKVPRVLKKYQK